jgi:hypothetical protein
MLHPSDTSAQQASILSLGTESRAWRLAASDWARQVWGRVPPRLRPSFVVSVDARVTSVDARVVSVDPRGNWW